MDGFMSKQLWARAVTPHDIEKCRRLGYKITYQPNPAGVTGGKDYTPKGVVNMTAAQRERREREWQRRLERIAGKQDHSDTDHRQIEAMFRKLAQ